MDRFEVAKFIDEKFVIWDNKTNDVYEYSSKYNTEEEAFKISESLNENRYGCWTKFD